MPSVRQRMAAVLRSEPRPFQIKGVRTLDKNQGRMLLGDDMGLGKTFQFIAYAAINPHLRPVLVVCPAPLKWNWRREFWKHARLRAEVLEGNKPYQPKRDIAIINYDILHHWVDKLHRWAKLLGIDECQRIKTRSTKRTKACCKLARRMRHIIPMSGTPIINRPVEFFPVLQMLDRKNFRSFLQYAMTYCDPKPGWKGRGWDYSGASNLLELHEKVAPLMIRRTKQEVLKDLPPKTRTVIPLDLTNNVQYRRARDHFLEWLGSTKGTSAVKKAKKAIAIVKIGALHQVLAEGKLKEVAEWIKDWREETGEKLVVFTVHKSIARSLAGLFPRSLVIDGDVPNRSRQAIVDQFQNESKHWLLIGTIATLGTGHTLTAASTVAFIELPWTPGEQDQAEDRVLRIGQTSKKMTAFYFVAHGTIEEDHLQLLDEKRDIVSQTVDGHESTNVLSSLLERMLGRMFDHAKD